MSPSQLLALQGCAEGNPWKGCYGRSSHGGRTATLYSLKRIGFIDPRTYKPTEKGLLILSATKRSEEAP